MLDAYQQELRRYEDIIYQLEYDKSVLCAENERLKQRADKPGSAPERVDRGPGLFAPRRPAATPTPGPRSTSPPSTSVPGDMDLSPPEIDLGPPSSSGRTQKPVAPEPEPSVIRKPLPAEVDTPPAETSPVEQSPVPERALPMSPAKPSDVDVPPSATSGKTKKPLLRDYSPDEPPHVPETVQPPAAQESLPPPKSPTHLRVPELLPAPAEKKTSQGQWMPRPASRTLHGSVPEMARREMHGPLTADGETKLVAPANASVDDVPEWSPRR